MYVRNGLWQQVGGKPYLFYHSGKTLSSVLSPHLLTDMYVTGNYGLMAYRFYQQGETSVKYVYFSLENLQLKMSKEEITVFKTFAYKALDNSRGLIFEPADDKLLVRRTEDFKVIQQTECKLLTDATQLYIVNAGIVAMEENGCYLFNSK